MNARNLGSLGSVALIVSAVFQVLQAFHVQVTPDQAEATINLIIAITPIAGVLLALWRHQGEKAKSDALQEKLEQLLAGQPAPAPVPPTPVTETKP